MRTTYKTGAREKSDIELLEEVYFYHKYIHNNHASTSNLTKAIYFENLLLKRGLTEEQITDYCNKRSSEEYTANKKN